MRPLAVARRLLAAACLLGLGLAGAAAPALAQTSAPVSAVVPPVCGGTDLVADLGNRDPAALARIEAEAAATPNAQALLWTVRGKSGPVSYLLGTIHLTDDRVTRLSPATLAALARVKTVALEIADLSPEAVSKAMAGVQDLLVYTDGRSLVGKLDADETRTARTVIEKLGIPADALQVLRPWFISMSMALSDCERQRADAGLKPLDAVLADLAAERKLPVRGLETVAEQMQAMAAVNEADQLVMLRAGLKTIDRTADLIESMVRLYVGRRLGVIWPLQAELIREAGFPPAAMESFRRELVTKRNLRMREAALPLLAEGGVLIGVGSLHLPGADGLVALLREAGFTVEPAE